MKNTIATLYGLLCVMICLGCFCAGAVFAAETDAELLSRYEPMWKSAFQKQNGFTDAEFQKNISVNAKSIMHSNTQKYFCVKYVSKLEWIEIPCHDQILIYMSSKEDAYKHIPLPRDTFFSEKEMDLAIQKSIDATVLTKVYKTGNLAYPSLQAAKDEVMLKTGINHFLKEETSFFVAGKLPRIDGDPYFVFSGTKDPAMPAPQAPDDSPSELEPQSSLSPNGNSEVAAPEAKSPASGLDPKSVPCSAIEPQEDAGPRSGRMAICAPEPGDDGASETCIKGYLNLKTKKLEFWSDAVRYY